MAVCVIAGFVLDLHIRVLSNVHDKMAFDDKIVFIAAILFEGIHFIPLLSFFECKKKAECFSAWNCFEVNILRQLYLI